MDTDEKIDVIKTLLIRAAETYDSGDAMRFSQAALNAANSLYSVGTILISRKAKSPDTSV